MAKKETYGFERRNRMDFDNYSVMIESAIVKMMRTSTLRISKAEIVRLTGIHLNTLRQRHWDTTQDLNYGDWDLAKGTPTSVDQLLEAVKLYGKGAKKRKMSTTSNEAVGNARLEELTQKLGRALHHNALITIELQQLCKQLDDTKSALEIARATHKREVGRFTEALEELKRERDDLKARVLQGRQVVTDAFTQKLQTE